MHSWKILVGVLTLAAAVAAPLSTASAHRYCDHRYYGAYYGGGPVAGVFDGAAAVIDGAVTIATTPIAIAADILSPGPYYDPIWVHYDARAYYGPGYGYYYRTHSYGQYRYWRDRNDGRWRNW